MPNSVISMKSQTSDTFGIKNSLFCNVSLNNWKTANTVLEKHASYSYKYARQYIIYIRNFTT